MASRAPRLVEDALDLRKSIPEKVRRELIDLVHDLQGESFALRSTEVMTAMVKLFLLTAKGHHRSETVRSVYRLIREGSAHGSD